jgi:hemoglobin/transferrin/lactoferrin receptor protein
VFSVRVKLEASAFYTYLDHALVRREYSYNGQDSLLYDGEMSRVLAIQNAAHAYVYGVQASAEVLLVYDFSLRSHISWQKGEEEDEEAGSYLPMRHVAPLYGSTHLIYKKGPVKADLYVNYNGAISNSKLAPSEQAKTHMYAANSEGLPYSPAWYTLNLKAEYRINDYLMAGAGIGNITDQRYRPYSSGITAPGRNIFVSLRAAY